jgi:hypothetical protein
MNAQKPDEQDMSTDTGVDSADAVMDALNQASVAIEAAKQAYQSQGGVGENVPEVRPASAPKTPKGNMLGALGL